ncbi:hypothetical protein QQS21_002990 [Conoideocrella luteorostrata]|uniref:G-patch domain-containing protein n=1 Tax=Conoideocrella luteorostrata TaxID=1105319 RepID=A0AAJ0CUX5_9HYPO|nr:hypothetical protein QQS21_002990 [Conoideocrella luteorostrata]
MASGRDHINRYDSPDDGYTRRGRSPQHRQRDPSRHNWDDQRPSYDGMYDDGPRAGSRHGGRYGDNGSNGGDYAHYDDHRGRSRSPRGRYRSRSRSWTRDAGKPTDTVILEGLPHSITAVELREGLLTCSIAADFPTVDVRLASSRGNRRAFVQFEDVGHATTFVKEHFPKLHIELQHSTDDAPDGNFEAFVHFARNRDDGGDTRPPRAADWPCPQCDFLNFSSRAICKICGATQSAAPGWEQSLTGAADVADGADAVSQILVVYPLASFVTEDMLVKDLKLLEKLEEPRNTANGPAKLKSTAPGTDTSRYGAKPNSLHRVFLMRDVKSGESFKYGFVEFWTLEDAAAAVTKFRMSRSFTVAGCAVTVAPTHMGVFLPEDRDTTPKNEHMSFNPLFNPSLRVRYRDLHVFPSQLLVTSEPPADVKSSAAKSAEDQEADGKKQKKRKADGSMAASVAKKPVVMAGQLAVWQRKHDELRADNPGSSVTGQSDFVPRSDANKAPIKISLSTSTKPGAPSGSLSSSAKQSSPPDRSPGKEPTAEPPTAAPSDNHQNHQPTGDSNAKEETYMDRDRLMCLICMRKYKSTDEVNIHEKSRNHKTAMEDAEKVKAAIPRLAARDKRLSKQADDASQTPQYRDRAKERRDVYNQPNKPAFQPLKAKGESAKKHADQEASKPTAAATAATAPPGPSKGAGMLAKMGWTAGAGLGANGEGRTEVIATNAYQEGVGLGAEGSNLGDAAEFAEKKTTNRYSEYLNTVQDKARERYNQMN